MRFLADFVLEAFEKNGFSGWFGGSKVSFKGDAGTQVLCHEVPG
jgi:hypothetical protein